jgi:hypothetical protein
MTGPAPESIHLVFKTHLDIGFTDYAANVVRTYFTAFIPGAIALAQHYHDLGGTQRFRWTTGAWLIYEYLEQAGAVERRQLEQAIDAGDIVWHALPFTTHTELMDAALFRYGLSLSQTLDRRFGRRTIAAKMTDVPGHTRAIVPLLAEAGVELLHIGVNPASSVPDVPPVFTWHDAASDTRLTVIYNDGYGGLTTVNGLRDHLAVVLTGDNEGPPSPRFVEATYAELARGYPEAVIRAATLDDFAAALRPLRDGLPVISEEIGDTWIFGAGSDPTKVRQYRELLRLNREWASRGLNDSDQARIQQFQRHLVMVPEHTWGMDEKTHFPDRTHYTRVELASIRPREDVTRFEASWREQRAYVESAVDALGGSPLADEAREALMALTPREPDVNAWTPTGDLRLECHNLRAALDPITGALHELVDLTSGRAWAGAENPLALVRCEVFGQSDYDRYWSQYIRNGDDPQVRPWAVEDNSKPGMPTRSGQRWKPEVRAVYADGPAHRLLLLAFPPELSDEFGAPRRLWLEYRCVGRTLEITLRWFDKPALRIAEALWLSFMPRVSRGARWQIDKLGSTIDPCQVISRGARALHAVESGAWVTDPYDGAGLRLTTHDAPLIAPGRPSLLDFPDALPDPQGGMHVNLYNNVWGTNFPMWFEEDALFRFTLSLT